MVRFDFSFVFLRQSKNPWLLNFPIKNSILIIRFSDNFLTHLFVPNDPNHTDD